MPCPRCAEEPDPQAVRCRHCGSRLAIARLEVVRGDAPERELHLRARSYLLGRARDSDLCLSEPSVSKAHARLVHEDGRFFIEDQGSLHGVYVDAIKVQGRVELVADSQIQLGNVTLRFSYLDPEPSTARKGVVFPWVEQQQLLLSLVQTLNSTLVLSQVLEQVLDAVMRITRAERGFLLLADTSVDGGAYEAVAGLRLRVSRLRSGGSPPSPVQGISTSVVRRALQTGRTVATGNAVADPFLGSARSVILGDLRTIVCIPLRSPRSEVQGGTHRALGALYVDNPETSASFSADSLKAAEALARHAALAIENAQLFEREQRTIEELRRAQSQLLQSEKLAAIGRMAAGLAHELKTPLTYIKGNLELLEVQDLEPVQREMLRAASAGAERIQSLTDRLLAFSRPSREQPLLLEANDVVERSLELCRYQILQAGVRLEKRLAPSLPQVRGDPRELDMALINLVVNAIHAMHQGGRLLVATSAGGGEVEIAVSDTGPGIPESLQATLFEPFVTTKPEGQGTGLGLSTALMVVQRHGGRIDFDTRPGEGTTFRIHLPAAP